MWNQVRSCPYNGPSCTAGFVGSRGTATCGLAAHVHTCSDGSSTEARPLVVGVPIRGRVRGGGAAGTGEAAVDGGNGSVGGGNGPVQPGGNEGGTVNTSRVKSAK